MYSCQETGDRTSPTRETGGCGELDPARTGTRLGERHNINRYSLSIFSDCSCLSHVAGAEKLLRLLAPLPREEVNKSILAKESLALQDCQKKRMLCGTDIECRQFIIRPNEKSE